MRDQPGKIYHEYYLTGTITLSLKYIIFFIDKFDFVFNYTLYKNAGFGLVNSRDIVYKFRPCIVNLQNFYFM